MQSIKRVKDLQAKVQGREKTATVELEALKVTLSQMEETLARQQAQAALFEAKAVESCELSEKWADKARKDQQHLKQLRHRFQHAAIRNVRRRIHRDTTMRVRCTLQWLICQLVSEYAPPHDRHACVRLHGGLRASIPCA